MAGLATPDVPKQHDRGGMEIHLNLKMKVIAVLTPVFKI